MDDCVEIHIHHSELGDPQLLNHQIFRSGHDCTSASSARSPCNFGDVAISVLRELSKNVGLPYTTFARGS